MIDPHLNEVLNRKIRQLLGAESHVVDLPLDLVSIACLNIIFEHEEIIKKSVFEKIALLNSESFFDKLAENEINVDGSAITAFNKLIQLEYITVDSDGNYSPNAKGLAVIGILNKLFPKMTGKLLIAYFIQTMDEVSTGRKERKEALDQLDQTLTGQGKKLNFEALNKEEKNLLKTAIKGAQASKAGKKAAIVRQRETQRGKVLDALSLRMNKMGELPILHYNANALHEIFELDERVISTIADISVTDFAIVSKLIQFVKNTSRANSEVSINNVTHALLEIGYDGARKELREHKNLADDRKHKLFKDIERAFQLSALSGKIAVELADLLDVDGIEDISACAMFFHFGQMIVMYYLPEAYLQIMILRSKKKMDRNAATREILGMTFEDVGVKIATDWQLPFHIIESMKINRIENIGTTKNTIIINLPYYVNSIILSVAQNFSGEYSSRIRKLIDKLHMPKNEIITIFETGWSKFYENALEKKFDTHRRDFLAQVAKHYS